MKVVIILTKLIVAVSLALLLVNCGGGSGNGGLVGESNTGLQIDSRDTTPPTITLNGNNPLTLEAGSNFTDPGSTATDDRDGNVAVTTSGNVANKTVGNYTITYKAKDNSGNEATKNRTVKVVDTTAPTITLKGDANITLHLNGNYIEQGVNTSDNANGKVNVVTSGSIDTTHIGIYILTYTASDSSGNKATAKREIKVIDVTAPTITLKGANPINLQKGATFNDPWVDTSDNATGEIKVSVTGNVDTSTVGEYTLTYTATDAFGNKASVTRVVKITHDNLALLYGKATEGSEYNSNYPASNVLDDDNETFNHTLGYSDTNWLQVELPEGVEVREIVIINRNCCETRLNEAKVYLNTQSHSGTFNEDNLVGTLTSDLEQTINISSGKVGNFILIKAHGSNYLNIAEVKVYGILPQQPIIKSTVIESFATFNKGEVAGKLDVIDHQGDPLTYEILDSNVPYSINSNGEFILTGNVQEGESYTFDVNVSDNHSHESVKTITIHIGHDNPPIIKLYGDKVVTIIKGTGFDARKDVEAMDDADGNITSQIQISGTVDTNSIGEYHLTYAVHDRKNQNAEPLTREIRVVDSLNDAMQRAFNDESAVGLSNKQLIEYMQAHKDNCTDTSYIKCNQFDSILTTVKNLESGNVPIHYPDDLDTEYGSYDRTTTVNGDNAKTAYYDGARNLRDMLENLSFYRNDIFKEGDNVNFIKAAILLGDKYRENIHYPMDKVKDAVAFSKALYADYSVTINRAHQPSQKDLGHYAGSSDNFANIPTINVTKTYEGWGYYHDKQSSGYYILPGVPVTIKRTDNSSTHAIVQVNMFRNNISIWAKDKKYTMPRYISSKSVRIDAGEEKTITSPYGGVIFMGIRQDQNVTLELHNVAQHPILRFGDGITKQKAKDFYNAIANGPFTLFDMVARSKLELHYTREQFMYALKSLNPDTDAQSGAEDTYNYLKPLEEFFFNDPYKQSGFRDSVSFGELPQYVETFCNKLDSKGDKNITELCIDPKIHHRKQRQHFIAEWNAACGTGCAGNPIDTGEWMDLNHGYVMAHEMGHTLQTEKTKIYQGASTEVSNNIYPMRAISRYYEYANIPANVWRHGRGFPKYDEVYQIVQDYIASGEAPSANSVIWRGGDNVGARRAFYMEFFFIHKSWDLFTAINVLERIANEKAKNDSDWSDYKAQLGFSNYTKDEHNSITAEDFMAIALSLITNLDHSDYFEAWGVKVSDKAKQQIKDNGATKKLPLQMYLVPDYNGMHNPIYGKDFLNIVAQPENLRNLDGSPVDNTTVNLDSAQEYKQKLDFEQGGQYVLENAPKGMAIYPNGTLAWTPTNDQAGDYTVTVNVKNGDSIVESKDLDFHVTNANKAYDGVFIDLSGNSNGDGSPQNPYGTYKDACEHLNGKHNIYLRGGIYKNPGYHSDWSKNGRYPAVGVECQGTTSYPIVIRPWSSEYVKLKTDALYGIRIKPGAEHITIQNIEIEGEAQKITLDDALKYWWWDNNDTMQSSGIVASGDDIIIKDNVVHDMPGSGISASAGAYADIEKNIVYNCDWWTIAGSKGIGITSAKGSDADGKYKNKIVGNLIFNIEQRLFSHVWKKKFATLNIDEGEAFLIQEGKQQDGTTSSSYNGKYLIQNNIILYNGKTGVLNLAKGINLTNNSYYNNGGATKQSGFRISHTKHLTIENNAVESNIPDTIIYSHDKNSSDVNLTNNYAKGTITNDGSTISGIESKNQIFKDPENFDFSIVPALPQNIGANNATIKDIKDKLELYNIKVERKHMEVDRAKQTKYIVEHAPGKVNCSHYNDEDSYIMITDINSSHTLVKDLHTHKFKLKIEHKYGECVESN